MSGNANQRKQRRDMKELVELGRQQKASIEAHEAALKAKSEEIAALKQRVSDLEVESMLRGKCLGEAEEQVDAQEKDISQLCAELEQVRKDFDVERQEYIRRHQAVQETLHATEERLKVADERLAKFEKDGVVTRKEHKRAVEEETKKLRERLRRKSERLLRAHVNFDKLGEVEDAEVES